MRVGYRDAGPTGLRGQKCGAESGEPAEKHGRNQPGKATETRGADANMKTGEPAGGSGLRASAFGGVEERRRRVASVQRTADVALNLE